MPGSNGDPVVGVIELVRPVELSVPAHQLVHEQQRNLRVAEFVQGTEASHGSPGTVTPKTRAAEIAYSCREFRERQSCRSGKTFSSVVYEKFQSSFRARDSHIEPPGGYRLPCRC